MGVLTLIGLLLGVGLLIYLLAFLINPEHFL